MAFPSQPFDEREQRYFLAEILKASSIAPTELLNLIRERGIAPSWMDMALPNGRTPSDCLRAFDALLGSSAGAPAQFPRHPLEQPMSASKSRKRQPQASDAPGSVTDRTLHPQQSNFPPVNAISDQATFQAIPTAQATSIEERPGKKRGRPSKAEYEQRVREAAERGEIYPPPRKRKTPRASLEGVAGEGINALSKTEYGAAGEGSTEKKKPRSKAAGKAAPFKPTLALEEDPTAVSIASGANKMEIDHEDQTLGSIIPETQSTDFPAQASLLSGMREFATQAGADTTQSTSTLKRDYSMPRTQREILTGLPASPESRSTTAAKRDSPTTKINVIDPATKG